MKRSEDDKDKVHFNSDRLICINGEWFFNIRESLEPLGPFSSREEAIREINRYKRDLESDPNPARSYKMYEGIFKR